MKLEERGNDLEVKLNTYFLPIIKDYETGELIKKPFIPYTIIQKFVKGPGEIFLNQQTMEKTGKWFSRKQYWDFEWKGKVEELEKILKEESEKDIKGFKNKKGKKKLCLNIDVYGDNKISLIETDIQKILTDKEMDFDLAAHTYSKLNDAMLVTSAALTAYAPIDITSLLIQTAPALFSGSVDTMTMFTFMFRLFIDYYLFYRMGKQMLESSLLNRKISKSKISGLERIESLISNKNTRIGENKETILQINEVNNYFKTLDGSLDEVYLKTALKAIDLYKSAKDEESKKSALDITRFYLGMTNKVISSFQDNIRKYLAFDMPISKGIEEILNVEAIKEKKEVKIIFPCYLLPSKDRHELITGGVEEGKPNELISALIAAGHLLNKGYKIKPVVEIRSGLELNDKALDYIKNEMFLNIFHNNLTTGKFSPLQLSEYLRVSAGRGLKTFLSSIAISGFFMFFIASTMFSSGNPLSIATGAYLISTFSSLMALSPLFLWKTNKAIKKYSNGTVRGLNKISKEIYDGNFEIVSTKLPEFSKLEEISEKYQGGLNIDEFLKKLRKDFKAHHEFFKELMYESKKMEMFDSVVNSYLMKDRWLQQSLSEPTYGITIENEKLKELLQ